MQINWNAILVFLAYAAITGVLNGLLAERSRIDAWAEANPNLAAVMKICRGLGIDPWQFVSGASLIVKGRLPLAQRAGKSLPPPPFEKKPSVPPPPSPPPPASFPPGMGGVFLLLLIVGAVTQSACGPSRPACDQATMAAVVADCTAKSQDCEARGISEDKCPTVPDCDKQIERACNE